MKISNKMSIREFAAFVSSYLESNGISTSECLDIKPDLFTYFCPQFKNVDAD